LFKKVVIKLYIVDMDR